MERRIFLKDTGLLAGGMGWEYLLGEIFGADHVGVGVDGMGLTQDCIGGVCEPSGIGDVFFRRLVLSEVLSIFRTLRERKAPIGRHTKRETVVLLGPNTLIIPGCLIHTSRMSS